MERMRTGKQSKLSPEDKAVLKQEKALEREKFESKNMGKYMLLYPLSKKVKQSLKQSCNDKMDQDENERIPDVVFIPKE